MHFWTYGNRKTCLDKCLKSLVSEDRSKRNMVNGPKQCSKLNGSTFTIFIDPCEGTSDWKSLSEWDRKSQDILLNYWMLITSFLFLRETIYSNYFRCNDLRNEKDFPNFYFCAFSKCRFRFEPFPKKDDRHN